MLKLSNIGGEILNGIVKIVIYCLGLGIILGAVAVILFWFF